MDQPLAIHRLHHLAVPTRDLPASVAFYENVLGFQSIPRPDFPFAGAWLSHEPSGLEIHIIQHESAAGRGPIDTLARHFAMSVADLDVVEQTLQRHQIDYCRQVNAGGFQQIFFQDPDGNTIELGIYPSPAVP
ncbi:MAG: glyoxalase [Planctomycetales bacterium]|nr:glyoxalase [Planctomycetales bacterium]NIM08140.1 glyoxalase [Planctomycetales bacterium]NIN07633.1 glyoxalase [Planctomycetales bacterium]NIN76750.1 glyoxalase [Planctomycetales bacterium]NIO33959.1 glyoxalase [Planctomycetales bacterium]